MKLTHRKAELQDIPHLIELLIEDDLGKVRELANQELDKRYMDAFYKIDSDTNQYLMVVEHEGKIVATCHLTLMPSLTFIGSTRMQIEAVRVAEKERDKKIGQWMLHQAIRYAKARGASILQLTTNKQRDRAKHFYEKLGFEASHEGMKLHLKH